MIRGIWLDYLEKWNLEANVGLGVGEKRVGDNESQYCVSRYTVFAFFS